MPTANCQPPTVIPYSMSILSIKVENLSKLYQLGQVGTGTLSKDLQRWWAATRGKEDPFAKLGQENRRDIKQESDFVWALQQIDFEVQQGEVLGIIGRNGAGKSTLLKILSKITAPTTGKVFINGRIASLLEVGTGFHPEMTGRENIFLNGALLGMSKADILARFDEIVDFAGVAAYIDTPVKRYSSGMYVRLAFAVAAYLHSEILVVDEVLAVGDSIFQKKCIDRMLSIVNQGRTVLFVSHNLSSIRALCRRGILLENGKMVMDNEISKVLDYYASQNIFFDTEIDLLPVVRERFFGSIRFARIRFAHNPFQFGQDIAFEVDLVKDNDCHQYDDVDLGFAINDLNGNRLLHVSNRFIHKPISFSHPRKTVRVKLQNNLKGGVYALELFLRVNDVIHDWLKEHIYLEILEGNPYGYGQSDLIYGQFIGSFEMEETGHEG